MRNKISKVWDKLYNFIRKRRGPVISVIQLKGVIGGASSIRTGLSLSSLDKGIEGAFSHSGLKAVVLIVNSPGGSPVQSLLISNRIRSLADEKKIPVLAFAEDVAASGGYWLLSSADQIYASPSSIIGSIGVVSGGFGFTELIKKLGIERRLYTSGEKKAMLDPFSPEKASDLRHLKKVQDDIHDEFVNIVKLRRNGLLKGPDREIFSGAFWTGKKALELGLIDGLGDFYSVINEKFGKNIRIKKMKENSSFFKRKFGLYGKSLFFDLNHENSSVLCENVISAIENRLKWNRFGL